MNKRFHLLIVFLPLFFFITTVQARAGEWKFDPVHSRIYFDIKHIYATVRGEFDDFSGKISIDSNNYGVTAVSMKVRADSVNTGVRQRDNDLRSADYFDVDKYPFMKFESKAVKHISGNSYRITGDLTIKDVTKEVTVPFTFLGERDNPMNPKQMVAGYEGKFTLDRLAYHVGSGKLFEMGVIGRNVDVTLTFEVLKDK